MIDITTGDILIHSGEGEIGSYERYHGARTVPALKTRLAGERHHGDRWAHALIGDGAGVYSVLSDDLTEVVDQREVTPASIVDMGCTSAQAMAELGVAHPTITKHARALGIKRRGRDYLFTAPDIERMRQSIAGAKPGRPKAT